MLLKVAFGNCRRTMCSVFGKQQKRMLTSKDYQNKYIAVIRSAFEMEPVTIDRPEVIDKLMARGFKIGTFRINDKKEKVCHQKAPYHACY